MTAVAEHPTAWAYSSPDPTAPPTPPGTDYTPPAVFTLPQDMGRECPGCWGSGWANLFGRVGLLINREPCRHCKLGLLIRTLQGLRRIDTTEPADQAPRHARNTGAGSGNLHPEPARSPAPLIPYAPVSVTTRREAATARHAAGRSTGPPPGCTGGTATVAHHAY